MAPAGPAMAAPRAAPTALSRILCLEVVVFIGVVLELKGFPGVVRACDDWWKIAGDCLERVWRFFLWKESRISGRGRYTAVAIDWTDIARGAVHPEPRY
jgi:hypothetical protein